MIPQEILDKISGIVLEDDNDPTTGGGIAFRGETVLDFLLSIDECDVEEMNSVDDLNKALHECGIMPIEVRG